MKRTSVLLLLLFVTCLPCGIIGQLEWLDPTMVVSTLTTTLTVIKFIKQLWAALSDGSNDIADILNIPGPLVIFSWNYYSYRHDNYSCFLLITIIITTTITMMIANTPVVTICPSSHFMPVQTRTTRHNSRKSPNGSVIIRFPIHSICFIPSKLN